MDTPQNTSKFKVIYLIIGVLLTAALVVGFINYKKSHSLKPLSNQQAKELEAKISQPQVSLVNDQKIPKNFPANIPTGSATDKVVSNYEAVSPNGSIQATREFESSKAIAENFALYNNFFKKSGWDIYSSNNQGEANSITAAKDLTTVQVLLFTNSESKKSSVRISATITKK